MVRKRFGSGTSCRHSGRSLPAAVLQASARGVKVYLLCSLADVRQGKSKHLNNLLAGRRLKANEAALVLLLLMCMLNAGYGPT